MPAPPVVATPAQTEAATKFVAMVIRASGWVAAAVFKSDVMKVPDQDARETAQLIVDGWPELATGEDAKKTLAIMAVGSLAAERYGKYQREPRARAAAPASPGSAPPGRVVGEITPDGVRSAPSLQEIKL